MTSTLQNNNSLYNDESQLIAKVITTPYERVLQILSKIRLFLVDILSTFKPTSSELSSNIINDLDWVVSKIKSHNLYSYEQNIDSEIIKQCQKSNSKLYQLIDYLTGNTELTRCSFQRSDMYSTIRKDLGLDDNEKIKKKSLKVQDSKLKEMEELRNETFVRNFFNKRSMSHGYQRRQVIGTKLKHKISLTEKSKASSDLENVIKNKEIITNITRIATGSKHPYNTTGDLGWCDESYITLYDNPEKKYEVEIELIDKDKLIDYIKEHPDKIVVMDGKALKDVFGL